MCKSLALEIVLTSPMLAPFVSSVELLFTIPDLRFVMLLPPMFTLPPSNLNSLPPIVKVAGPPFLIVLMLFKSLAKPMLISLLPSAPWVMLVLMLEESYSESALAPVPFTVTLEPSLFFFSPPELASKRKPSSNVATSCLLLL